MKKLYVIETTDKTDNEKDVIGVASTLEYAELMIIEFFGFKNFKINRKHVIEESGLEYVLYITVLKDEYFNSYRAEVVVRNFIINEV